MSGMVHETLRLMIRSKVLSSNIRVFAFITLKSQSRPNSLALALALFTIPIDRSTRYISEYASAASLQCSAVTVSSSIFDTLDD